MQIRHNDRKQYFFELAKSCGKYYLPFVESIENRSLDHEYSVLEIGCGEGGNLLPFAKRGCLVTGIDISVTRIEQAANYFAEENAKGSFLCEDIFRTSHSGRYNLIIIHDVIEHVEDKQRLLQIAASFLATDGLIYIGFPAWQMPFGGHQQICQSRLLSRVPFVHLLPKELYRYVLKAAGENVDTVNELIDIKKCATSIEIFKKTLETTILTTVCESYYLVNPHYEVKFGLKPRILSPVIAKIPYLRNFFTTSYFCLLKSREVN